MDLTHKGAREDDVLYRSTVDSADSNATQKNFRAHSKGVSVHFRQPKVHEILLTQEPDIEV